MKRAPQGRFRANGMLGSRPLTGCVLTGEQNPSAKSCSRSQRVSEITDWLKERRKAIWSQMVEFILQMSMQIPLLVVHVLQLVMPRLFLNLAGVGRLPLTLVGLMFHHSHRRHPRVMLPYHHPPVLQPHPHKLLPRPPPQSQCLCPMYQPQQLPKGLYPHLRHLYPSYRRQVLKKHPPRRSTGTWSMQRR